MELPLWDGPVAEPGFAPGEEHSSEDPTGVVWRVTDDVLTRTTTAEVLSESTYAIPHDGSASESYAGSVSVDRRTFEQRADAETTFRLSWPGVAVRLTSSLVGRRDGRLLRRPRGGHGVRRRRVRRGADRAPHLARDPAPVSRGKGDNPVTVALEDPRAADVVALLERHLTFARSESPPEDAHALDVEGLTGPDISFFTLRRDGELLAVGALRRLDGDHAEIKSMHTAEGHRGQGLARLHAGAPAAARPRRRGSPGSAWRPARWRSSRRPGRSTDARASSTCPPFGDYRPSDWSTFLTRSL